MTTTREHISIGGPSELVAAINDQFGFVPKDSLVLVMMVPDGSGRLFQHCLARMDLGARPDLSALQGTEQVMVVRYADTLCDTDDLAADVHAMLPGTQIHQIVQVVGDYWLSADETGRVPNISPMSAIRAFQGQVMSASREALVGAVMPGPRAERITAPANLPSICDQADAWRTILSGTALTEIPDETLAIAAASIAANTAMRDWLCQIPTPEAGDIVPITFEGALALYAMCAAIPDRIAVDLLAVTGYWCWEVGSGVRARAALDRGLAIRPEHRLCRLLSTMVDAGARL